MRARSVHTEQIILWIATLAICGLFVSIHFSRALFSIFSIILWAGAIAQIFLKRPLKLSSSSIILFVLSAIWVLDVLLRGGGDEAYGSLGIRIGFILTALSFLSIRFGRVHKMTFSIALLITMTITSTASVVHYFANRAEIDALLLQSKHIPLYSEMHHIHFGVLLAAAILVGIWLIRNWNGSAGVKYVLLAFVVLLVFNIHVLSSRTGLTGFWVMSFAGGIYYMMMNRDRRKKGLIVGMAGILLVIFAIAVIPSMKSKLTNTVEDISATIEGGEDINHKSFAMRVEAWKTAVFIIAEQPIVGVGMGNQTVAMQKAYERRRSLLDPENRIGVHNQYLELGVTNGILSVGLLIALLIILVRERISKSELIRIMAIVLVIWSLCFESMIERQHSALITAFLLFFDFDNSVEETTP